MPHITVEFVGPVRRPCPERKLTLEVEPTWRSGYYEVVLEIDVDGKARRDHAFFVVRPEVGRPTFDLGDDWTHLCTVGPERIDPEEELGIVPDNRDRVLALAGDRFLERGERYVSEGRVRAIDEDGDGIRTFSLLIRSQAIELRNQRSTPVSSDLQRQPGRDDEVGGPNPLAPTNHSW